MINENSLTDDGAGFSAFYDTMDFTTPQAFQSVFGRWSEIEFEAKGSTIEVQVSKNGGSSYETIEAEQSLNASFDYVRIPIDVSARKLRVRFVSDKAFGLRWVRVWVREGGPR